MVHEPMQVGPAVLRICSRREDVMRKLSILVPLFLLMGLNAWADDAPTIVGSWKLVSTAATTLDGRSVASPMGEHPTGFLTYTADGRMSLLITHDGRPKLSGDRLDSPIEERAGAFSTMVAYAG